MTKVYMPNPENKTQFGSIVEMAELVRLARAVFELPRRREWCTEDSPYCYRRRVNNEVYNARMDAFLSRANVLLIDEQGMHHRANVRLFNTLALQFELQVVTHPQSKPGWTHGHIEHPRARVYYNRHVGLMNSVIKRPQRCV